MMENLQDKLDFFDEDVKDLQTRLEDELQDVQARRSQERCKIIQVTTLMKTIIQKAEDKLLAENDQLFSQFEEIVKKCLETSNQIKNEISHIRDDAEAIQTNDQMTVTKLQQNYDTLLDRFTSLQKTIVAPVFKRVDDDIEVLKNMDIGFFEHTENLNEGANRVQTISFSSQLDKEFKPCFPTGFLWVDGIIIVSDKGNKTLKFFTEDGKFISELIFTNASPYGVCQIKEKCFAVTLAKMRQIYLVSLVDSIAEVISSFQTYSGYTGLCPGFKTGSLIATVVSHNLGESHVDVIGMQGQIFITFQNDPALGVPLFKFPRYVVANQGVIIISDWRKNSVIFLHESTGSVLKEYKGTRDFPLADPYGICLDETGNVYVLNGKKGSVHVLDLQCNLVEVIEATSELMAPRLLAFDNNSGRLAVTYGSGEIKSFHHRVPATVSTEPVTPPPHTPSFLLPPKDDAHLRCPSPSF